MAGDPMMPLLSSFGVSMGPPTPAGVKAIGDVAKMFAPKPVVAKPPAPGGSDVVVAGPDRVPPVAVNLNQAFPQQQQIPAQINLGIPNQRTGQSSSPLPNGVQGTMLVMQQGPPMIGAILTMQAGPPRIGTLAPIGMPVRSRPTAKHSIGRIEAIGIGLIGDDRTGANYQFPPLVGQLMLASVNWPRNLLLLMDAFGVSPNALVHLANALNALLIDFSALVGIERDWIENERICLSGMRTSGPDGEKIIAKMTALDNVSRPLEKLRKEGEHFLLGSGGGDDRGAVAIVSPALDAIRSAADSAAKKSNSDGPEKDAVPALVGVDKGRDALAAKVMRDHKFEIGQKKGGGLHIPTYSRRLPENELRSRRHD